MIKFARAFEEIEAELTAGGTVKFKIYEISPGDFDYWNSLLVNHLEKLASFQDEAAKIMQSLDINEDTSIQEKRVQDFVEKLKEHKSSKEFLCKHEEIWQIMTCQTDVSFINKVYPSILSKVYDAFFKLSPLFEVAKKKDLNVCNTVMENSEALGDLAKLLSS